MIRFGSIFLLVLSSFLASSQSVEWIDRQENYQVGLGQTIRIPIRIRNSSDRAQTIVVSKAMAELGLNQKGYFCMGDECLDPQIDQITKRLEPGEMLTNLFFTVEPGLFPNLNSFRFEAFPKGSPQAGQEHNFSLSVEEKPVKSFVFQSRDITIHDVYPNPVTDREAFIDYRMNDESIKAKVVIHNILGSPVGNYELPSFETRVKIQADELSSGVYFYTLYLDNVGVLTRKMVVRK